MLVHIVVGYELFMAHKSSLLFVDKMRDIRM